MVGISREPPDMDWVRSTCKIGQGAECCRYLCMSPDGWSCAKHTELARHLDARVAAHSIIARGDNCPGRGSR